jgi:predicted outer membrane protein
MSNEHLIDLLCIKHHFALMAGHQQSPFAELLTSKNLLLIPVELVEKLPQDIPLHDMLSPEAVRECEDVDERDDDVDYLDEDIEKAEKHGRNHTSYGIDTEDTATLQRVIQTLEPFGLN